MYNYSTANRHCRCTNGVCVWLCNWMDHLETWTGSVWHSTHNNVLYALSGIISATVFIDAQNKTIWLKCQMSDMWSCMHRQNPPAVIFSDSSAVHLISAKNAFIMSAELHGSWRSAHYRTRKLVCTQCTFIPLSSHKQSHEQDKIQPSQKLEIKF